MNIKEYNFRVRVLGNDCIRIEKSDDMCWVVCGPAKDGFMYQFGNSVTPGADFVISAKKISNDWCEPIIAYDIYDMSKPLRFQKVETDCRMSLMDIGQPMKSMFDCL